MTKRLTEQVIVAVLGFLFGAVFATVIAPGVARAGKHAND